MRVAAIGDNCFDIYPKIGRNYPTGNAVDFAVHMQRLGIPASIISYTGNDRYGKLMADSLRFEGVDISHLHIVKGRTALTYMDMNGTDRIHGEYLEGVLENMIFTDEDIGFAGKHDLVHTALWGKAEHSLKKIKSQGAKISFDYATKLNNTLLEKTLPYVDYAFFSCTESRSAPIEEYLIDTVREGPQLAVATFGSEGSLAFDGREFFEFGVFEGKVVNTVGAGDSFIAGFMYGILNDYPIGKCLENGARIASNVIGLFEPW
ncbi:fructoselysine 6-kinase [Scopulibacillus cellulosilyticus]|uniref:Fructoselysine 6-kinase n=1 Tax=Scopulibacillus cellulosilyticus TaxID=2665665 RepID=A0ABW2Q0G0_9BACL